MRLFIVIETIVLLGVIVLGGFLYMEEKSTSVLLKEEIALVQADKDEQIAVAQNSLAKIDHHQQELVLWNQTADALAEILTQERTRQVELFTKVIELVDQYSATSTAFFQNPNPELYEEFHSTIQLLSDTFNQARVHAEGMRQYIEEHEDVLSDYSEIIDPIIDSLEKNLTKNPILQTQVDNSLASFRESNFTVLANQSWQTTDVDLEEGEIVVVSSTGKWKWGQQIGNTVGPQGENGGPIYRIVSNVGNGALIARVRGSDKILIGWPAFRPDRQGRIEFRMNDKDYKDNKGALDLTIWIFRPLNLIEDTG